MIVIVEVPGVAVALAISVKVFVDVVGFALNDAVTPLGRPDADKVTLPVKPLKELTVTMLEPLSP